MFKDYDYGFNTIYKAVVDHEVDQIGMNQKEFEERYVELFGEQQTTKGLVFESQKERCWVPFGEAKKLLSYYVYSVKNHPEDHARLFVAKVAFHYKDRQDFEVIEEIG